MLHQTHSEGKVSPALLSRPPLCFEIRLRHHLSQPAHSPVERKNLVGMAPSSFLLANTEQFHGIRCCCTEELHLHLVQAVDQGDHTSHLITLLHRQLGNASNEQGGESLADGQVVGRAQRAITQLAKRKEGHLSILSTLWYLDPAALHLNLRAGHNATPAHLVEFPLQEGLLLLTIRSDVNRIISLFGLHPIVLVALDIVHLAKLLQHGNERHKKRPVQPILVQVLWRAI
mmetsp:Transcript_34637/g.80876  ORF Transcript_34637/g.80876 Transcript_34637/m.80876 type:complete len:230 (+) Transcript_34637:194-883(+)